MKARNVTYAGALLAALALSACSNDLDKNSEWGDKGVRFTSAIAGMQTRVANGSNAWQDGDQLGIYMAKAGETVDKALASNSQYTAAVNGKLTAAATALEYPADGNVDFTAYYPYTATVTNGAVAVDVSDQTKPIDLLYAKTANVAKSSDAVNLVFSHQLSYVVLNISTSDKTATNGLKVVLEGTKTAGSFNLNDKSLNVTDASVKDITFNTNADGTISAGIALPTTSLTDAKLAFTLGDKTVEKELSANVTSLVAGSKYTIPVTISSGNTPSTLNVTFGNATISDWTTGAVTGNIDVDFNGGGEVTPPASEGDGTKTSPYSVSQALTKQADAGKDAWVKGYIVGYVDNAGKVYYSNSANDNYNVVLAASATETDASKCFAVKLKNNDVRDAVGLKSTPANLGKEVQLYGTFAANKYTAKLFILDAASAASFDGGKTIIGTDPDDNGGDTPAPTTTPGTLTKSADLTEGTYAIAYYDGTAYKLMKNATKSVNYVDFTDWTTGTVPAECTFTLSKSGDGWLIKGNDGKYVYAEQVTNNGKTYINLKVGGTDTSKSWTFTDDTKGGVKAQYTGITTKWITYSTYKGYNEYTMGYSGSDNFYPSLYKIK